MNIRVIADVIYSLRDRVIG